jgi:pimeloyl-ACP methyl ester carboxylesterase
VPKAPVNGIDLFYEADGREDPLLLIAGFGCDHTAWAFATPALARRYRVIRPDNRGSGRSDAPDRPTSMR